MTTVQIVYASRALEAGADLDAILAVSRTRNAAMSLTGYLLAGPDWFVQILEGPETAVEATYARIAGDRRHADLTLLARRPVRGRSFPRWSMGGHPIGPRDDSLLARHGLAAGFDPRSTPMPMLMALAMDLQDAEEAA